MPTKNRMSQLLTVLFWGMLSVCTWLSLTPQPPGVLAGVSDKLLHLLAWLALSLACSSAYRRSSPWLRFALLFGYSFLIEVVQYFVPGRQFSLLDQLANTIGLLGGMLLWALAVKLDRRQ